MGVDKTVGLGFKKDKMLGLGFASHMKSVGLGFATYHEVGRLGDEIIS